jgi:hypothetical protein
MCNYQPTVSLVVSETIKNILQSTNSQFKGLPTAQVVDPLPFYRDFPALIQG